MRADTEIRVQAPRGMGSKRVREGHEMLCLDRAAGFACSSPSENVACESLCISISSFIERAVKATCTTTSSYTSWQYNQRYRMVTDASKRPFYVPTSSFKTSQVALEVCCAAQSDMYTNRSLHKDPLRNLLVHVRREPPRPVARVQVRNIPFLKRSEREDLRPEAQPRQVVAQLVACGRTRALSQHSSAAARKCVPDGA